MLGSQLNALDTSAIFRTPYLADNQSTEGDSRKDEMVRQAMPSPNHAEDKVILNPETLAKLESLNEDNGTEASRVSPGGKELSPEDEEEIEKLKDRDREVRRHEQAHFQAAGNYASPPKYEYQTGPDGKRYAIGGSVEIDTSEVTGDPEATLNKARVIKRAALAPEEPSAQDRKVAREADRMAAEAQKDITEQRMDSTKALANGEPAAQAPASKPEIEAGEEIATSNSVQSPTKTLEATAQEISRGNVSQYKTAQLEMSADQIYRVERLATPSKAQLYTPSLPQVDMYV